MDLKQINTNKTYLVTGAAGFIGMHLSQKLLELGCKVIGVDNMNNYYNVCLKYNRLKILKGYSNFSFYKVDLIDRSCLQNIFEYSRVDVVINLAAQAGVRYSLDNPGEYIQSNIVGFLNILEMCRHFNVEHLLYASSSSVYGANQKVPYSTDDRVDNPISLYAATKKSNELMAYTYSHLYKVPTTGLRFFTVYGPFGRPDMAYYSFTKSIINGEAIKVFNYGEMYRDFTYIDDIIEGITRLIENSASINNANNYKNYNIGNNKPEKLLDFISTIENALNREAIKEFLPMQPGDVYKTYADITDIVNDVGFRPRVSIQEGIKNFVNWYKTNELERGIN